MNFHQKRNYSLDKNKRFLPHYMFKDVEKYPIFIKAFHREAAEQKLRLHFLHPTIDCKEIIHWTSFLEISLENSRPSYVASDYHSLLKYYESELNVRNRLFSFMIYHENATEVQFDCRNYYIKKRKSTLHAPSSEKGVYIAMRCKMQHILPAHIPFIKMHLITICSFIYTICNISDIITQTAMSRTIMEEVLTSIGFTKIKNERTSGWKLLKTNFNTEIMV